MDEIKNFFRAFNLNDLNLGVTDIIEMILIAYFIYRLLVWVKNTRTWFLLKGLVAILVFYIIAYVLKFDTILFIVNKALDILLIALLVVFQPELRKALEKLGHGNIFNVFKNSKIMNDVGLDSGVIKELVDGSYSLSDTRTGALIVIERETPLTEYIETGIKVDASITSQLLINIFEHNTPLHDGAVVINRGRINAATCYLPLTSNGNLSKALGTRHRAAIGVSEVTDSITIVVSEETGKVSVAENGNLREGLRRDELFAILSEAFAVTESVKQSKFSKLKAKKRRQKNEKADPQ